MKRVKLSIKTAIICYLVLSTGGCTELQDICQYHGYQVVAKDNPPAGGWYKVRMDGKISDRIWLVDMDYNRWMVGDTIVCR
jgi:hypothetical protein